MPDALTLPPATGLEPYIAAVGMAGLSQTTSIPVALPATLPGRAAFYAKPTNTAFTLAQIAGGLGRFVSTLSTQTVWTLPTLATLGYTWSFGKSLLIPIQRQGLGPVFLNPAICRGTVASQVAMLAILGVATGDYVIRSDLGGQVFHLTGSTVVSGQLGSTLTNWAAYPAGQANQPTSAGIVIHDPDGLAPSNLARWQGSVLELVGPDEWCYG